MPYSTRNRTRDDNDRHDALSAREAMDRYGYDGLEDVMETSVMRGSVHACCSCGQMVEPDGHCSHGRPSIQLKASLI